MIYYLYFRRDGVPTGRAIKNNHGAFEFFQNNPDMVESGEQGRLFSFWLGKDGDPN